MKRSKKEKVLVTGADGFIGSHLVERLVREGFRVKAFTFYNSFNSWGWLDTLPPGILDKIEIFAGDIRDPYGVRSAVKGSDAVIHLAALIAIPFSYHSPDAYVDTNIKGVMNVLQAAKDYGVSKIIITSTSEVYGTAKYVPIDEGHPLQPQSPYSATKIAADALAESFCRSFNLPVVIARPFNTYGPRQSIRGVIPTIIIQALNKKKKINLGSLHPTRDFNYVLDTCKGFQCLLGCNEALGKTVNIGSGREVSIGKLAELILELTGSSAQITFEEIRQRPANSEVERLLCDNRLMSKLTGWRPEVSLEDGLEKTVAWFNKNLHLYKSNIYGV